MLVKTGDAEVLEIVNPEDTQSDDKRKDALAEALEKAKKRIQPTATDNKEDETTEN